MYFTTRCFLLSCACFTSLAMRLHLRHLLKLAFSHQETGSLKQKHFYSTEKGREMFAKGEIRCVYLFRRQIVLLFFFAPLSPNSMDRLNCFQKDSVGTKENQYRATTPPNDFSSKPAAVL